MLHIFFLLARESEEKKLEKREKPEKITGGIAHINGLVELLLCMVVRNEAINYFYKKVNKLCF